jgi:hypothetical protein
MDDKGPREKMEASENTELRLGASGSSALHRADPDWVTQTLSSRGDPAGYARLSLMVSTIFDRLVAGDRELSRSARAAAGRSGPRAARARR